MKKSLIRLFFFTIIFSQIFDIKTLEALVPYYYFPEKRNLKQDSLLIGKKAYQLLYLGQLRDSLNFAKLAVKINNKNDTLWMILTEAQIANKLYEDALISLNKAQNINPKMSEIYFVKSNIYLTQSNLNKARSSLQKGIKIQPENFKAIFQLGNIYLMEKKYEKALKEFENALKVKKDYWQAINNKGLAYYELNQISLAIKSFKKAIDLEDNAESLLALASCLRNRDISEAIFLAKKALNKEPNYVQYTYRKEQLWGEKLQNSTKKLFENEKLLKEVLFAKTKIN